MKRLYYGMILAVGLGLWSCDGAGSLSDKVAGAWTGTPESLPVDAGYSSTIIENYSFQRDSVDGSNGGNVLMTGLVSVMTQLPEINWVMEPISLSTSGTVTISGTWRAVDDDELSVSFNPLSIDVNIDPDAVAVSDNILTGQNSVGFDSIKAKAAVNVAAQIRRAVELRYSRIKKFDDVKVKGQIMQMEVGDTDYVFTRSGK